MASSSNGNGNLMDEFEEAFQACLHALTKQESNTGITKEEIELEVQQTANKFIDVARQMDAFFLQKRFLISALKPEMLLKDENQELRYEISRKDNLINKHYNRLEEWKALLSDQQQGYSKPIQSQNDLRSVNNPGNVGGGMPPNAPPGQMSGGMVPPGSGMSNVLQAQLQQQHLAAQQQQQQMMQAQQMQQQMQQMQVGQQQMYMQQQSGPPVVSRGGGFNQGGGGGGGNMLQGPLAYLEKTTSNIDLVGMGDGRR